MVKRPNEDLFADTTMSFGEHLEELRVALAKAVVGLVLGFVLGLCVSNYVVGWIQEPLKASLENHYINQAVDRLSADYRSEGRELPPEVKTFMEKNRVVFDKLYVETGEITRLQTLLEEQKAITPTAEQAGAAEPPAEQAGAAEPTAEQPAAEDAPAAAEPPPPAAREIATLHKAVVHPPDSPLLGTRIWKPINAVVRSLSAQEAFMIWVKVGFVTGVLIASPYIFWQLWSFVAAGLYPHEKRYVYLYLPFSLLLFFWGAGMAFFFAFSYVLDFLFNFNRAMNIDPDPRISEWLGFVVFLPLGFGIAFQLPLVMLFLHRIRLLTVRAYVNKWRISLLIIFVASAILTPSPDPISMLMMALPLTFLYFLGIALCKWMPHNRNPYAQGYEP